MIATLHKYIGDETVIFNSLASSFHIPSLLQAYNKSLEKANKKGEKSS